MFQARIKNPYPLFIFANIINNAVIDYLHQRAGNFVLKDKIIEYYHQGNGWGDLEIVKELHLQFLESAENRTVSQSGIFTITSECLSILSFTLVALFLRSIFKALTKNSCSLPISHTIIPGKMLCWETLSVFMKHFKTSDNF